MVEIANDAATTHLLVCDRFSEVTASAEGRWDSPTPCPEWDARAIVEHLIGFHDELLLRPLRAKPQRPRNDPARRWAVTVDALRDLFARPGLFNQVIDVPAMGDAPASEIDARKLVPGLSTDVLVHTWDLARAVDGDDRLDPELCAHFLASLPADPDALEQTGLFAPAVVVPDDADAQARLLARVGRDPHWRAP